MVGRLHEPLRSIGEVAESLDLPQHVLRFWETRFKEIDPVKRAGGRRLYRPRDIEIVVAIRHLLYSEGYTIKGVQRILKEQGVDAVVAGALQRKDGAPGDGESPRDAPLPAENFSGDDGAVDPAAKLVVDGMTAASMAAEVMAAPPIESSTTGPQASAPEPTADPQPPLLPAARPLNEDDARRLRAALAEIEECRRLLRLTIR